MSAIAQKWEALNKADLVRSQRRTLPARLRNGTLNLADVIREPPEWLFSMRVFELLLHAPGVGQTRMNKALRRADVWPLKEVGRLTDRQRERLVGELVSMDRAA